MIRRQLYRIPTVALAWGVCLGCGAAEHAADGAAGDGTRGLGIPAEDTAAESPGTSAPSPSGESPAKSVDAFALPLVWQSEAPFGFDTYSELFVAVDPIRWSFIGMKDDGVYWVSEREIEGPFAEIRPPVIDDSRTLRAFAARADDGYRVFIKNGAKSRTLGPYTAVDAIGFPPGTRTWSFAASEGDRTTVVYPDRTLGPFENAYMMTDMDEEPFGFWYTATRKGRQLQIIHGVEYARAGVYPHYFGFQDGGKVWSFLSETEAGEAYVGVNGQERGPYDEIISLETSDDPAAFGYIARKKRSYVLMIGGEEATSSKPLSNLAFSTNGARHGYVRSDRKEDVVVLDGTTVALSGGRAESLVFSEDGRAWACAYRLGDQRYLMVNGDRFGPFDELSEVAFSADGGTWAVGAVLDGVCFALVNGARIEMCTAGCSSPPWPHLYDNEWELAFRAQESTVLYTPKRGCEAYDEIRPLTVTEGVGESVFEAVGDGVRRLLVGSEVFDIDPQGGIYDFVFSRHSKRWAFVSNDGRTTSVTVDGRSYGPFSFDWEGAVFPHERYSRPVLSEVDDSWGVVGYKQSPKGLAHAVILNGVEYGPFDAATVTAGPTGLVAGVIRSGRLSIYRR